MTIKELTKLAKKVGSIIVMEDSEPNVVVLSYEVYQNLIDSPQAQPTQHQMDADVPEARLASSAEASSLTGSEPDQSLIESLNQEIQALNDEISEVERNNGDSPVI